MKIFLVGGAVRDKLLGLPIKERDWVIVGATEEQLLQQGFRQVGKEFPVFLHPKTHEEYALARKERKVKPGYTGFTFDTSPVVTLEDDLSRRDLTINAMAETLEGELVDPFQGKKDLDARILRHVSPAFAEDPVRILRLGRFLARYAHLGFNVAPETVTLMQNMVAAGEVDALVAERVWKELERALAEKNPEQFFLILAQCQALPILFPHLLPHGPGLAALRAAAQFSTDTCIRFAALFHHLPEDKPEGDARTFIAQLCQRYRVPNMFREVALLTATHYKQALRAPQLTAEELLQLFNALDIFRREERFQRFVSACMAIAYAENKTLANDWLITGAAIARDVDVQALIAEGYEGNALAQRLKEERLHKIADWLQNLL